MSYTQLVKFIAWDPKKNDQLKETRGVSFEDVIDVMLGDGLLDVFQNPSKKYVHQKIYLVEINEYAYMVPCVEDEEKVYLKTVIPSRKYTKLYIEKGDI